MHGDDQAVLGAKVEVPVSYLAHFSPHNLALLSDWLAETGELYVDIYWPHSGGSGPSYFIRSMHDLKALVAEQRHPEICFTIFRRMQYALRGVANDDLPNQALQQIPDGEWYRIVSLEDYYPSPCVYFGAGNSHTELRDEFSELTGVSVGVGQDPFDYLDHKSIFARPFEAFTLSVTKNQNYYENYAKEPERYKSVLDIWHE